jgi:hypothetical protein
VTGYCEHPGEEGAELTEVELYEVDGERVWLCRRHRP